MMIGYKVSITVLEGVIKQLKSNNRILSKVPLTTKVSNAIAKNNEQIQIIKDAAPILA